jgi:hypothetical protein
MNYKNENNYGNNYYRLGFNDIIILKNNTHLL